MELKTDNPLIMDGIKLDGFTENDRDIVKQFIEVCNVCYDRVGEDAKLLNWAQQIEQYCLVKDLPYLLNYETVMVEQEKHIKTLSPVYIYNHLVNIIQSQDQYTTVIEYNLETCKSVYNQVVTDYTNQYITLVNSALWKKYPKRDLHLYLGWEQNGKTDELIKMLGKDDVSIDSTLPASLNLYLFAKRVTVYGTEQYTNGFNLYKQLSDLLLKQETKAICYQELLNGEPVDKVTENYITRLQKNYIDIKEDIINLRGSLTWIDELMESNEERANMFIDTV